MQTPNHEFVAANGESLGSIIFESQRLLAVSPRIRVVQPGLDAEAMVLETPFTSEYFHDAYDGAIDIHSANELAAMDARTARGIGASAIISLNVLASISYMANESSKGNDVQLKDLLPFASAEYTKAFTADNTAIEHTALTDIQQVGSADMIAVSNTAELTTSSLTIVTVAEKVMGLDYKVLPTEDEDMARWVGLMGESFSKHFLEIAAGSYQSTDDIEAASSNALLDFEGTPKEQDVKAAIIEIRKRAVAAKEARIMSSQFQVGLPTAAILEETVADLRRS